MSKKDILKNIVSLLAFLITGILSGIFVTLYLFDTMPLMDQSTIPENPVGIVILPFFAFFLCSVALVILGTLLFTMRKSVRVSLLLFCKKESKICITFKIIGYLIILRIVYSGIRDLFEFKQFFINGLCYYTSAVAFVLICMMIFVSIITRKSKNE